MEVEETGGCWPDTRMVRSSLVLGMQRDIAAIKDCLPEGVWLKARFWFLLQGWYLTVVSQGDDGLRLMKAPGNGAQTSVTDVRLCLREAYHESSQRLRAGGSGPLDGTLRTNRSKLGDGFIV